MTDEEQSVHIGNIDFRLTSIEGTLNELKDLLIKVPLLSKNLDTLEHNIERDIGELERDVNKDIGELNNRMGKSEKDIQSLFDFCRRLEQEPTKKSAEKWQTIVDYVFKAVMAFIMGLVAVKLNVQ